METLSRFSHLATPNAMIYEMVQCTSSHTIFASALLHKTENQQKKTPVSQNLLQEQKQVQEITMRVVLDMRMLLSSPLLTE